MATLVSAESPVRLRNILLATDFSSSSEAALPHALALARRYDSQLYVAYVIRPDFFEMIPTDQAETVKEGARRHAQDQMTQLLISGRLRGIPHQVLIGEGPLWGVLENQIAQHQIDLVVVGTHGRTGARKLLLGSAAEEIFRLAPCPVLTVGPKVSGEYSLESPARILYATDFKEQSDRAAAYAASLAQENQAHLTLLHVVKEVNEISMQNAAMLREFFIRRLKGILPPEAESWCEPEFVVEFGDPADIVLRITGEHKTELVVLGIRRSATFAGHLPPATAYKVVCQSRCPVLTVRG